MKRYIALISVLLAFATALVGCNLNRVGTDKYYVQITTDGKEEVSKDRHGEIQGKKFEYKLPGFNEEGKEEQLEFTAQHNLRKDAFLRVYYSKDKGVKSWEEVKGNELPVKVKEKLGVK
ncbi:YxeA family protein [Bacillus thuringiensis]|uniref:YxeA family protein n=1 Tax=Bacillus thuringiensis TaxID=1428 RepID=A0A9X6TLW0_BACTU|nr:YxeA family protein [Bacillus thuringiensis]PEA88871.1 hypothetical protein CON71_16235 [Bacillus thuringiensis]